MADPNVKRMSAKEGRAFRGSEEVLSMISLEAVVALETTSKRVIGQRGMTHKVIGYDVTGTITQFKSTAWIRDSIKTYVNTGVFPTFDMQAVMDDPDSDYFENNGSDRVQFIGVQLTGDLPVVSLDSDGEEIEEEVTFSAAEIRWG